MANLLPFKPHLTFRKGQWTCRHRWMAVSTHWVRKRGGPVPTPDAAYRGFVDTWFRWWRNV